ncbi:MFS transporter [Mycolicibacterium agri]|uniref:MFS transporter n=1 Tax=Mycolicibacterium agri TaxID=36811 RepID=UPI0010544CD2|nr:MFS transporter [Mycolicibacterium agri]
MQLANVSTVLPFICAQQGIYWAAGLLYPAFSIGIIFGNSISSFILNLSRRRKHLVLAATASTTSATIVCNAIAAQTALLIASVFLTTSLVAGVAKGVSKVAFSEVVSSKVSEARRADLVLNQGAFGSILAIVTTLLLLPMATRRDGALTRHVDLLWLGAAALAAAGVAAVFVGPVRSASQRAARRFRDTYREGMAAVRADQWFRRYTVTSLLFVPISLGTTFYSLHAAAQFGDKAGSLHVLVVFASIGLLLGSFLWRWVYRKRFGVRGMLLLSALIGSTAALICMTVQAFHGWSQVWAQGIVFLLATVASQAIFTAGIAWVNIYAADYQRATLFGFSAVAVAVETSLLGAGLGVIAQKSSAIWPVVILLILNLVAAVAALRAPTRS